MKKITLFFVLLIFLTGCSKQTSSTTTSTVSNASPTASSKELVDNIYFRKGESSEGDIVLTSIHIEDISIGSNSNALEISFTEEGRRIFYECTSELSKTNEKLSIWVGDEKLFSASITDAINSNKVSLNENFTYDERNNFYNKIHGIPSEEPYEPIDKETLDNILTTVTSSFSYEYDEELISSGEAIVIPEPYKNTEKSKITSEEDIINLAKKEVSGEYSISVSYDSGNKLWSISFMSDDSSEKSYCVILSGYSNTIVHCFR